MQPFKCPTLPIPSSTLLKSKSLLQTTVLNEQQWAQPNSEALFAQALATERSAALCAYLAGSLFLAACLQLAEAMLGMMPLLCALLLARCLLHPPRLNSASRHLSLRTSTFQARLTDSTRPTLLWSDLLFQPTAHHRAAHGSSSMAFSKHQRCYRATRTCTLSLLVKSSTATIKALPFLAQSPHRPEQAWSSAPLTTQTSCECGSMWF